jgi:hypothetical protein
MKFIFDVNGTDFCFTTSEKVYNILFVWTCDHGDFIRKMEVIESGTPSQFISGHDVIIKQAEMHGFKANRNPSCLYSAISTLRKVNNFNKKLSPEFNIEIIPLAELKQNPIDKEGSITIKKSEVMELKK